MGWTKIKFRDHFLWPSQRALPTVAIQDRGTAVLIHLSMADEVVGIRVKCKKFFIPHVFLPFNGNNNEQELTKFK